MARGGRHEADVAEPAASLRAGRPASGGLVIVLTGPPGAGKTTIARALSQQLPSPTVHLHSDDFWRFIKRGAIAAYQPESDHQNRVVMDVLARAAFGYAAGGYRVLLDGIVGPWFVDRFRAESAVREVPLHYVVLRPDQATAERRAVARGGDELVELEPIRHMYRQFMDLAGFGAHVLDSSTLSEEETASAVRRGMEEGRFHLSPRPA